MATPPSPCRINNAGTGYQNPAPALLIVILFSTQINSLSALQTVKETIGVGVNEKAALSSDKNCPFVYINFDFTLVNKVASL